jgi:hypothetical protein
VGWVDGEKSALEGVDLGGVFTGIGGGLVGLAFDFGRGFRGGVGSWTRFGDCFEPGF